MNHVILQAGVVRINYQQLNCGYGDWTGAYSCGVKQCCGFKEVQDVQRAPCIASANVEKTV